MSYWLLHSLIYLTMESKRYNVVTTRWQSGFCFVLGSLNTKKRGSQSAFIILLGVLTFTNIH